MIHKKKSHAVSLIVALILLLALALRLLAQSHNLWYDELYTLAHYASQPWSAIVAGSYSPNNQILSTLLIKADNELADSCGAGSAWLLTTVAEPHFFVLNPDVGTLRLHLSSILAGILAALALAQPLKKNARSIKPYLALLALAAAYPWLLQISTEARGYAILLLLSILATNRLTKLPNRFDWLYPLCLIAAIYTIPIALLLIPSHAIALLLQPKPRKTVFRRWLTAAGIALAGSLLLYLPFLLSMRHYVQTAPQIPASYPALINALLQTAVTGWESHHPLDTLLALALILPGCFFAWRNPTLAALKPTLLAFSTALAISLLTPLFIPSFTAVRFFVWLIPIAILSFLGLLLAVPKSLFPLAALIIAAFFLMQDGWQIQTPPQPTLDAIRAADAAAPPQAPIIGISLGAKETMMLYLPQFHHVPRFVSTRSELAALESTAASPPWLIVFYDDALALSQPELAAYITSHYRLEKRLPGRISAVSIWSPNPPATQSAPSSRN